MKKERFRLVIHSSIWKANIVNKTIWEVSEFAANLNLPKYLPQGVMFFHNTKDLKFFIYKY